MNSSEKGFLLVLCTAVISGFSIWINKYGVNGFNPFVFTTPDFVLKELHWLDQNTAGSLFADRPINDIINPSNL